MPLHKQSSEASVSEWRLSLAMISNEPFSWDTSIFSAKNPVENVEQVWVQIHVQSNDTLSDVDRDGEGKKSNRSMSSRPSHVKLQWVPTL
jgi:hypothetical protein